MVRLLEARRMRPISDLPNVDRPAPSFLALRTPADDPLGELVDFMDWTPDSHAWEARGRGVR